MNVSKPVFVSVILLGVITGLMVSQVIASGGHYRSNPLGQIWEAITELQSSVETLEDRVTTLEEQAASLVFTTAPDYDSGWLSIEPLQVYILAHNLNTTEVFVYLIGKNPFGIHQMNYGGNFDGNRWRGAHWKNLNATHIYIFRHQYDTDAMVQWNYIRVMIWKISEP